MRTALVFGVTFAAGALFFACAKGDDAVTADGGGGGDDATEDGSVGDGAQDGNTSYVTDSGKSADASDAGSDAAPICVESDAGCATGSPGACSDGILHCDGGVAVCEAVTTTEPCYSGGGSTRNTGVCHDGTQTCTGTLGACTGEVDPAASEDCFNNLDDDCNGLVNDGCPDYVYLGSDVDLTARGGTGGGAATIHCPSGAYVTRVDSYFDHQDSEGSGVSIFCATPTLVKGTSSYSITLAANTPAPYLVSTGSTDVHNDRTDDCGIAGLVGMTGFVGLSDGSHVQGLGAHCGSGTINVIGNALAFTFTSEGGGYNYYGSSPFFDDECAINQVLVGFNLRHGAYLDNIQPICAPLFAHYSAGTADP